MLTDRWWHSILVEIVLLLFRPDSSSWLLHPDDHNPNSFVLSVLMMITKIINFDDNNDYEHDDAMMHWCRC